jgi:hypothetical protein
MDENDASPFSTRSLKLDGLKPSSFVTSRDRLGPGSNILEGFNRRWKRAEEGWAFFRAGRPRGGSLPAIPGAGALALQPQPTAAQ